MFSRDAAFAVVAVYLAKKLSTRTISYFQLRLSVEKCFERRDKRIRNKKKSFVSYLFSCIDSILTTPVTISQAFSRVW